MFPCCHQLWECVSCDIHRYAYSLSFQDPGARLLFDNHCMEKARQFLLQVLHDKRFAPKEKGMFSTFIQTN